MTNNDCLRRIRYILNLDDSAMMKIFSLANYQITREQVCAMLKKEDDPEYENCKDILFATFLNGLIIDKRGKREGDQFTAQIDDLTPGMTYYIRAFAQNSKGMNYGSVRRIKIEGIYNAPFESSPVGGNWYLSEWFGLFMRGNANWIFHQELGWLYHEPVNGDGMWVWNDRFKWTWSRKDIWPYMWVNRDGNWFYYFGVEGGNPTFWDYNSRAYTQWLDK